MVENHTGATLFGGHKDREVSCCYCRQNGHEPRSCAKVRKVEDRKQILRRTARCFICLRRGHISSQCRSSNRCTRCKERHHISICNKNEQGTGTHAKKLDPGADAFNPEPSATLCATYTSKAILLQTAEATVHNQRHPKRKAVARFILDTGSQRSYITDRLRKKLGLQTLSTTTVTVLTFGSRDEFREKCDIVKVAVVSKDGDELELKLLTIPVICEPLNRPSIQQCVQHHPHLSHLELADTGRGTQIEPDILIGSDFYWHLGETIRGDTGPTAINTKLGWVLSGPVMGKPGLDTATLVTHVLRVDTTTELRQLDTSLQRFWDLESLGIVDKEEQVYEQFTEHISIREGRYEFPLPWKDPLATIPSNYELSLGRLKKLMQRLKQDPETFKAYDAIIGEQLKAGIVEVVERPNEQDGERVHYLPHHAVIRKDKDTRIVYDASARTIGPSLNDCLHTGPKLQRHILNLLLMFRTYRIALTADIEKAFLNISVAVADRDVLRFQWITQENEAEYDIQVLRFTRVVFGVSSSPFLLNATIRKHVEGYSKGHQPMMAKLVSSFYVDDMVCGAEEEEEALELYQNSKEIMKDGGFNLQKFTTNSPQLQAHIDEKEEGTRKGTGEETYAGSTLGKTLQPLKGEHKVLGVLWDVCQDELVFDLNPIAREARESEPTKRKVISIVSKFFDPRVQ